MRHILPFFLLIVLVACMPAEKAPGTINNREAGMPSPEAIGGQDAVTPASGMPIFPMYLEPFATPTVGIPPSPPSPYDPKVEDARWTQGRVYLRGSDVMVLESYPPRYVLVLRGSLPTPCHQLRIRVQPPDAQNQVFIEVYSVTDPDKICIQVLRDFEVQYPLNLPPAYYTFWVNGEKVGTRK